MASIVRYEPIHLTDRWTNSSFDRFFGRLMQDALGTPSVARSSRPSIAANLYETPESYWVELPLPGVKPEDVEVSVHQNLLSLKAKREWPAPEQARPVWQGFTSGQWQQTLTLPGEVDAERVEASLEHGVLRLQLPRAAHARPRQIKVQVGSANNAPIPAERAEGSAN
jgi:HSP20 family protein